MAEPISTTVILTGTGVLIGGIITGITTGKKLPLFRNNNNNKKGCPESTCHDKVIDTSRRVEVLEKGQIEIFNQLNDINRNMPGRIVTLLKDTKDLL